MRDLDSAVGRLDNILMSVYVVVALLIFAVALVSSVRLSLAVHPVFWHFLLYLSSAEPHIRESLGCVISFLPSSSLLYVCSNADVYLAGFFL
jgi:hypothetical protein